MRCAYTRLTKKFDEGIFMCKDVFFVGARFVYLKCGMRKRVTHGQRHA